jgi:hypothetical protein
LSVSPIHADPLDRRGGPLVRRPDERDHLFQALRERPPRHGPPGLGGVAMAPRLGTELPPQLVRLVRRQRQQRRAADQVTGLAALDRPAATGDDQPRVLGRPLLQHQAHGRHVRHPVHHRAEPPGDLAGAVDAERAVGVIGRPRPQDQAFGDQLLRHLVSPDGQSSESGRRREADGRRLLTPM